MKKKKEILKNIMLMVVTIVIMFACFEIAGRIYYRKKILPKTKDIDILTYADKNGEKLMPMPGMLKITYDPYMTYHQMGNQHTELFDINSHGFRNDEISKKKAENTYRIIVTGGSAAFCKGVKGNENTWPILLQNMLNKSLPDTINVEILNAGINGFQTEQELAYLQMYLLDYKPDMLLAFNGWNDFYAIANSFHLYADQPERVGKHQFAFLSDYFIAQSQRANWRLDSSAKTFFTSIANQSILMQMYRFKTWKFFPDWYIEQRYFDPIENRDYVALAAKNYGKSLDRMAAVCQANDVKAMFVLQPELFAKNHKTEGEEFLVEHTLTTKKNKFPFDKSVAAFYHAFVEEGQKVSDKRSVPYYDSRKALQNVKSDCYLDFCHLNDEGCRVIAKYLKNKVLDCMSD